MEFIQSLDYQILSFIAESVRSDFLTPIMLFITRLGDGGIVWLILAAICLVKKKTRPCGAAMLLSLAIGLLIGNLTIKPLVARPRPFLTYPELTNLVAQGATLSPLHMRCPHSPLQRCFIFFRKNGHTAYGIPVLILAALIALSRLYVCVHYPSDVLCGTLLGIVIAVISVWLIKRSKVLRRNMQEDFPHEK